MRRCPLCGSAMVKQAEGVVSELIMRQGGALERVARPAVWYGCPTCEHCEEVTRA